jgi:hypothetical protein
MALNNQVFVFIMASHTQPPQPGIKHLFVRCRTGQLTQFASNAVFLDEFQSHTISSFINFLCKTVKNDPVQA